LAAPLLDTDPAALACDTSGPGVIPPPGSITTPHAPPAPPPPPPPPPPAAPGPPRPAAPGPATPAAQPDCTRPAAPPDDTRPFSGVARRPEVGGGASHTSQASAVTAPDARPGVKGPLPPFHVVARGVRGPLPPIGGGKAPSPHYPARHGRGCAARGAGVTADATRRQALMIRCRCTRHDGYSDTQ